MLTCAHVLGPWRLVESLERILADRVEQAEAPVGAAADEALLDERLERVEVGVADGLGRLDREAARERRERSEELLFVRLEEPVAPFDRGAQRSLPRRRAAGTIRQQGQQPFEPRQQERWP